MNLIRKNIDDLEVSEKQAMCGKRNDSITHLIAGCKKLSQKEYRQWQQKIARIVHLKLCQNLGLADEVKWYNKKREGVLENDVKILWHFNIQTNHVIQSSRPDMVRLYRLEGKCYLINIVVPGDKRVQLKQQKVRKIQWSKAGNKNDLELVTSYVWDSCNWDKFEKFERLV